MRKTSILGPCFLATTLLGIGCGGSVTGPSSDSSTGDQGTSTSASSSTSGGGGNGGASSTSAGAGSSSTSTTGSSSGGGTDPCSPGAACPQVSSSTCIALVDNSATTKFTLRMSDLNLTAPPSLAKGLVKGVVQNGATMNLASCNLYGGGTFSWLLQFDTIGGTLTTGGAKPAQDPTQGYAFVNETILQGGKPFTITPIVVPTPINGGAFATSMGKYVILPVYLDLAATAVILLPLHEAKLTGILSADRGCIGKYNSAGLDPAGGCTADASNPAFIGANGQADSDGHLDGYIPLEEADTVIIDAIAQSLCVVLSGDAATYGDGGMPAKCKRTGGKINFQGDWCAASNNMACNDSAHLTASFSASGVKAN